MKEYKIFLSKMLMEPRYMRR